MYCGNCRTELPTGSNTCPLCGALNEWASAVRPQVMYAAADDSVQIECPNCGTVIADGAAFCGCCGQKVNILTAYRMPKCVTCGAVLTLSARFCSQCRTEYKEAANGYIDLPREPICDVCGAELPDSTEFCIKCGKKADRNNLIAKKVIPCCSECGAEINPGDLFCMECGKEWCRGDRKKTAVPILLTDSLRREAQIQCPACGQIQFATRKVCFNCGIKFIND